jgi:integrase
MSRRRQPNGRAKIYLGADGRYHDWVTMCVKDDGSLDRRHRSARTATEVEEKVKELERESPHRWSIGLALGTRQGEALGLHWTYVDLDKDLVKIWWKPQRTTWRHGCADPHACGEGPPQAFETPACTTDATPPPASSSSKASTSAS